MKRRKFHFDDRIKPARFSMPSMRPFYSYHRFHQIPINNGRKIFPVAELDLINFPLKVFFFMSRKMDYCITFTIYVSTFYVWWYLKINEHFHNQYVHNSSVSFEVQVRTFNIKPICVKIYCIIFARILHKLGNYFICFLIVGNKFTA